MIEGIIFFSQCGCCGADGPTPPPIIDPGGNDWTDDGDWGTDPGPNNRASKIEVIWNLPGGNLTTPYFAPNPTTVRMGPLFPQAEPSRVSLDELSNGATYSGTIFPRPGDNKLVVEVRSGPALNGFGFDIQTGNGSYHLHWDNLSQEYPITPAMGFGLTFSAYPVLRGVPGQAVMVGARAYFKA